MPESRNIYIDGYALSNYKGRICHDLALLEMSLKTKKEKDILKKANAFIHQLLRDAKRILWKDVEFIDGIIEHLGLTYESHDGQTWPVIDGNIIVIGSEDSGYIKQIGQGVNT